jgi:hypothetical protein
LSKPSIWKNSPAEWVLGDETAAMKGLAPSVGPATPIQLAELEANMRCIKLPPGLMIEVYASGLPEA